MLRSFLRLSLLSRQNFPTKNFTRSLKGSQNFYSKEKKQQLKKELMIKDPFEEIKNKNKNTYLDMIKIFVNSEHSYRTGHVDFIYSALKNMEQFGVNKDLEVYKALIDVLPKGRYVFC